MPHRLLPRRDNDLFQLEADLELLRELDPTIAPFRLHLAVFDTKQGRELLYHRPSADIVALWGDLVEPVSAMYPPSVFDHIPTGGDDEEVLEERFRKLICAEGIPPYELEELLIRMFPGRFNVEEPLRVVVNANWVWFQRELFRWSGFDQPLLG